MFAWKPGIYIYTCTYLHNAHCQFKNKLYLVEQLFLGKYETMLTKYICLIVQSSLIEYSFIEFCVLKRGIKYQKLEENSRIILLTSIYKNNEFEAQRSQITCLVQNFLNDKARAGTSSSHSSYYTVQCCIHKNLP